MQYSKKVINHFKNPKNQGIIKKADAIGEKGNPVCGDVMKIYLKIGVQENKKTHSTGSGQAKKQEYYIKDIKFETLGCVAAIAVSSALTEVVKGKTLDYALKINKNTIVKKLGGLPDVKIHCSMLGIEALREAINKFKNK
ncbi:iron-sulfur cluster assembly scaffold protein [Candidatus Falkowbacteria bacterium]|nr:MAG: iron-sulfur cluster assembly scaffold protein [Candidatus Falkowbacteria bacterium]